MRPLSPVCWWRCTSVRQSGWPVFLRSPSWSTPARRSQSRQSNRTVAESPSLAVRASQDFSGMPPLPSVRLGADLSVVQGQSSKAVNGIPRASLSTAQTSPPALAGQLPQLHHAFDSKGFRSDQPIRPLKASSRLAVLRGESSMSCGKCSAHLNDGRAVKCSNDRCSCSYELFEGHSPTGTPKQKHVKLTFSGTINRSGGDELHLTARITLSDKVLSCSI
jgi:hypothetical protein